MRLDLDCKRGDEWPNLSELDVPQRPRQNWRTLLAIFLAWTGFFVIIALLFLLLLAVVTEARSGYTSNASRSFGVLMDVKTSAVAVAGSRCLPHEQRLLPPK